VLFLIGYTMVYHIDRFYDQITTKMSLRISVQPMHFAVSTSWSPSLFIP